MYTADNEHAQQGEGPKSHVIEVQSATHHYRIAQELNNMGVTMLRCGLLEDAGETFLEAFLAMQMPKPSPASVAHPDPADAPLSTETDQRIKKAKARLPSKKLPEAFITRRISSIRNTAIHNNSKYTAPLYSDVALVKNGITQKKERFNHLFIAMSNSIIVHNMALVYHLIGFKTNDESKIKKALSLYQKAHALLMRVGYFEEKRFQGRAFLFRLEVAILNNMGQIFYETGEQEDAYLCLDVLSVLQGKVSYFCLMLDVLLRPRRHSSAAA